MTLLKQILFDRWYWRAIIFILAAAAAVLGLIGPYYQKEFVDDLQDENSISAVLLAFACLVLSQACYQLANYIGMREAIIQQKKIAQMLYQKMLDLRYDTMSHRPIGEIVALYATDVSGATIFLEQTIPTGASTFFRFIFAPIAIAQIFGVALWPTLITMALVTIVCTTLAFRQSKFFFRFKKIAAERLGLVSEWVQNIRTIRILGWIDVFENNIYKKRVIETENRVAMVTNGQIMNSITSSITFFLNIISLLTLLYLSNVTPTRGELLALLWIIGIFLTRPFRQMPWFFTFAFDGWTSIKRLETFLEQTQADSIQTQKLLTSKKTNPTQPNSLALEVQDLKLQIRNKVILDDISFSVRSGEFIAIVGEVGSGKSMLFYSLLRETAAQFGQYNINGIDAFSMTVEELRRRFAFVPQESFIMSASLRENVAFLYDIDLSHDNELKRSLQRAQFNLDAESVAHGLDTEIGERGVNLSGGQRQRVNLARVHYLSQDILLLDDCLSAVDVQTEKALMRDLIGDEWKNKTKLLITHRLSILPFVDRILFLQEGKLIAHGTYQELIQLSESFRDFTQSLEIIQSEEHHEI